MVKKKNKKARAVMGDVSTFVITFFVLVLVGFFIFTNITVGQKRVEMIQKIDSLKTEIDELEQKNGNLKATLINSEDSSYLEEEARSQGYKMPGETQVVVIPNDEFDNSAEKKTGFWSSLLNKIGL
jgi:cell division protein FtsB